MSAGAAPALRHAEVRVGAIASPVIEAGPPEAREAVVFVHGNPGSRTDWTELVAAVGALARAVALDMPGFGQAEAPREFAYQVSSYADFLAGALEELGIERVHLVLHDFGGPFGLSWGLAHPDAWASVTLIDVGVLPGYRWHSMARRWRTPLLGELAQAWIPRWAWRRAMQSSGPKGLPPEFVEKMYDDYDRATRRAVLALYRATPDPGQAASTLGPELAKLRRPALVVWGAKDPFAGAEYAERQREFFDVRQLVILPDSGHWPFQDDPPAVRDALLSFLRGQLGSAPAHA
ncbi:MAG TPA: alpha/beta hydrolase [Solirubrobacteraceae bacterium]|nr:alpha/beta hydrolase [Solirubrobacteraceae bacterium]